MTLKIALATISVCGVALASAHGTFAAVTPEEAAQLKTVLTPLGAERAGNKDGTIPAWEGGNTTPTPGFVNGGPRPDPFADEKPLFSITAKNMGQYADKLSDGVKAMFQKYPDTYRLDVYPTHRTAAAPQWVYDNTAKCATTAHINGLPVEGAFACIPFPIPKSGNEVMWNHLLRWRGEAWHEMSSNITITADGTQVLVSDSGFSQNMPYYFRDHADEFAGDYWLIHQDTSGPPIRVGEAIVGRENIDPDRTQSWVYLTGQRRVRKLPVACCDTPTPAFAGLASFDEIEGWTGRQDRFDWKILGKKEVYIPYNTNRSVVPTKTSDVLSAHHFNPDYLRWELHRVWVVEANLAANKRHQAPKGIYYVDEDSWSVALVDRWDANGQLWKTLLNILIDCPDIPAIVAVSFGMNDLLSNSWFAANLINGKSEQYKYMPPYDDKVFTPEAMAGKNVR